MLKRNGVTWERCYQMPPAIRCSQFAQLQLHRAINDIMSSRVYPTRSTSTSAPEHVAGRARLIYGIFLVRDVYHLWEYVAQTVVETGPALW